MRTTHPVRCQVSALVITASLACPPVLLAEPQVLMSTPSRPVFETGGTPSQQVVILSVEASTPIMGAHWATRDGHIIESKTYSTDAARALVDGLSLQNAAFAIATQASIRDFVQRGYRKADAVTVVRVRPSDDARLEDERSAIYSTRDVASVPLRAEHYEYWQWNGTIVMDSWDDGDPATWEGHVFWSRDDGVWASANMQIDLTASEWDDPVLWASHNAANPEPSAPPPAHYQGLNCVNSYEVMIQFYKTIFRNRWASIATWAPFCRLSGPAWPGCVGVVIGGNLLEEYVTQVPHLLEACACGLLGGQYCQ